MARRYAVAAWVVAMVIVTQGQADAFGGHAPGEEGHEPNYWTGKPAPGFKPVVIEATKRPKHASVGMTTREIKSEVAKFERSVQGLAKAARKVDRKSGDIADDSRKVRRDMRALAWKAGSWTGNWATVKKFLTKVADGKREAEIEREVQEVQDMARKTQKEMLSDTMAFETEVVELGESPVVKEATQRESVLLQEAQAFDEGATNVMADQEAAREVADEAMILTTKVFAQPPSKLKEIGGSTILDDMSSIVKMEDKASKEWGGVEQEVAGTNKDAPAPTSESDDDPHGSFSDDCYTAGNSTGTNGQLQPCE